MGREAQQPSDSPLHRLQWALVLCQAVSMLITWSLWQVRCADHPFPNLPLIQGVPQFGVGWLLLLSLAIVLVRPIWGLAMHAAILALAIVQDEARLQPEFLSLVLLLVGTLPRRWTAEFARAHLGSLWLWAGLHKVVSDGYWTSEGMQFVQIYWLEAPDAIAKLGCAVVAVSELMLGIATFVPNARRFVPLGATLVHGGALLWLTCKTWNYAVWPWQIAMILAAWSLFWEPVAQCRPETEGQGTTRDGRMHWLIAFPMLIYPMLYYVNLLPPAPAWCVYAGNVPTAMLFPPVTLGENRLPEIRSGTSLTYGGFDALNVPYPSMPSSCHRFLQWYGKEGASITVQDPRPLSRWNGRGRLVLTKTAAGVRIDVQPRSIDSTPAEPE